MVKGMKMRFALFALTGILWLFSLPLSAQEQPAEDAVTDEELAEDGIVIDMEAVDADEAFMSGVRSFHNGEYANALLSFERSLSWKPDRPLTWLWLGNSYHRLGLPDLAISQWQRVLDTEYATAAIRDRVDALLYQKSLGPQLSPPPVLSRWIAWREEPKSSTSSWALHQSCLDRTAGLTSSLSLLTKLSLSV